MTGHARALALAGVLAGLATLVVLRLLLIHNSMSQILYWEEPYRLTIATEILGETHLPLAEYQADHYQGGSLAVGLVAVPFVVAFGPSFETLKLVPLLFTLATAALWCILLWRAVSPWAAVADAWLLALAPPNAQIYQVHAMGSHAESALFTAAGFLVVREIAAGARSRALPFLLGVIGGLGLWFCYTAASGIAAWGLVWLFATPRGSVRRGFAPLLGGALLGIMPWIAYNAHNDFRGLDRLTELLDSSRPIVTGSEEPFSTRVEALFAVDLPRSFGFPEKTAGVPGSDAWVNLALLAAAVIAMAGLAAWGGLLLGVLISLTVAIHLAIYCLSSFRLDVETGFIAYRFFSPLFPLATAALAIVTTRLSTTRLRVAALLPLLVALALGGYGTASLLRERVAKPESSEGYRLLGLLTAIKHRERLPHAASLVARLSGAPRKLAFFGYGWGLEFEYEKYGSWPNFSAGLALCPTAADRAAALDGIRWSMGQRLKSTRDQANAGFRVDYNRRTMIRLAEFAGRVRALPAPSA